MPCYFFFSILKYYTEIKSQLIGLKVTTNKLYLKDLECAHFFHSVSAVCSFVYALLYVCCASVCI